MGIKNSYCYTGCWWHWVTGSLGAKIVLALSPLEPPACCRGQGQPLQAKPCLFLGASSGNSCWSWLWQELALLFGSAAWAEPLPPSLEVPLHFGKVTTLVSLAFPWIPLEKLLLVLPQH